MNHRCTISLLLTVFVAACAYQPTPSSDTFGYFTLSPQIKGSLVTRTEHDMGCPLAEQTFKWLGNLTVGVTGCGVRGTYKYVNTIGWVMDAAGADPQSAPAPAAVEPAVAPPATTPPPTTPPPA